MQNFLIKSKVTQLSLITCLLLFAACGKQRTNILAKGYHKTTSYFNGYYNANEILKATTRMIDDQYQYPGGGLFDIYYIGTEDEVKNYEGDFDKIIEKNDIVIYKHPNGGFADDCRFMNGQSHYFKKDYRKAMENFDDVIESYPESKILPKTYLWKAMTYYEAGNPELAIDILETHIYPFDTIEFDKKGVLDMAIFQSKLALDTSNYMAAAETIAPIVDEVKGRHNRAKAHFLLAQLHAKTEDFPQSFEHFELVEKYSQDYELTFMSKMKIAHLYIDFSEGQDDDSQVYEYLTKLLNDEKNLDYADQILYELGQLELKKDSIDNSLAYFRESILANKGKPRFRALSSYAIGKIFFERFQQYDSAQIYFDAASSAITKNDAEYEEITTIAKTLKDYVNFKNTIAYQDSMLYLYSLSEEDLEKKVAQVAEAEEKRKQEEERKAEQKRREEERALRENMGGNGGRGMNNNFMNNFGERGNNDRQQGRAGNWYFDNPTAVTQGITQFQAKWGRRANEDHWRRSRKDLSFANNEDGEEAELSPEQQEADSLMKEEFGDNFKYYVDIPKNSKDSTKSEAMIEEAMYGLGRIYAQKLNEPDSAIKVFEGLLDRYENSDFDLRSRYALYQIYKEMENPIFNVHRNFILNEHPKSIYAYLILGKDPNELKEEENDFSYAYTGLLTSYRNRQYETAIGFSEFLLGQFGTDNPKLDYAELHYIRGMAYGYMGNRDSLRDILTYVVNAYPEADVTPVAKRTLDYMNTGKTKGTRPSSTSTSKGSEGGDPSLTDPNNPRYQGFAQEPKANDKIFVLMYIDQKNVKKGDATSKVSNFNKANFAKLNLKTFTFLYKSQYLLPYISHFKNEEEAVAYVNGFLADPVSKELLPAETDRVFYISHSNFKVAYGRKRMEDYMLYFENILNK